jgi:CBS domain-containing protein
MATKHINKHSSSHESSQAKQLKDVMTPDPGCCLPSDTVQQAARIMKEKDTGIVPVIESEKNHKLVGVITDRDICLAIAEEDVEPDELLVEKCMARNVIVGHPDDSVDKAVNLMEEQLIRRIPVVDERNRIQGIVSMADIVCRSPVKAEQMQEALEKISEPASASSKPRATMSTGDSGL